MTSEPRLRSLLRPFTDVRSGEAVTALALTANAFLLLTAYYLLKTVREPLILAGGGAEVKSYAAAAQILLLVPLVTVYDRLATRVGRLRLILLVQLFFVAQLGVLPILGRAGVPLGVAFHLWLGIFNLVVIAQFWSFAADVYTPEQGRRLFALIGIGSSLGAVFGAGLAGWLIPALGPWTCMWIAAVILLASLLPAAWVHRREPHAGDTRPRSAELPARAVLSRESGLALLLRDRYLVWVAAFTLMISWVATLGEYVLDRCLLETVAARGLEIGSYVGAFKAELYGWVSVVALVLQLFFVSRIFRYLGVRVALVLPVLLALGAYGLLAVLPMLTLVAVVKVAEGGVAYSLQSTVRQSLFLTAPRQAKYRAKTIIDTLLWRAGDALAAGVVWLGSLLALDTRAFLLVNVVLCALWLAIVVAVAREHLRRADDGVAVARVAVERLPGGASP